MAPGPIATDGRPAPLVVPRSDYAPLDPITPRRIDPNETRYRLRFTPDPLMALRRFESDVYWSGAIEVPVRPPPDGLRPWRRARGAIQRGSEAVARFVVRRTAATALALAGAAAGLA